MSEVIVTFKNKTWKAKGVNFHQDHLMGRVALLIKLKNNHSRLIYPANYMQEVDEDNNWVITIHEGDLQPKKSHDTILKVIEDNNVSYATMQVNYNG